MFLAVVSYVMGIFMETFIPRRGFLSWLNPVSHLSYLLPQLFLNMCR